MREDQRSGDERERKRRVHQPKRSDVLPDGDERDARGEGADDAVDVGDDDAVVPEEARSGHEPDADEDAQRLRPRVPERREHAHLSTSFTRERR